MHRQRHSIRRLLAAATCVAAVTSSGCARLTTTVLDIGSWGWHPDRDVQHSDTAYESGGRRVAMERFAPRDARGRHPAVLVLHTSVGPRGPSGALVRRWADALARHGYVAFVVHYFDRTGDTRTDDEREDLVFPAWSAALSDAVTFAERDSAVDHRRVSALGISLGGYMALALGATDARVDRLVVLSGGLFHALTPEIRRLPPTLLLHGSDDDVVPVAEAQHAYDVLTRLHVPRGLVVYPGAGHSLDPADRPDVMTRAMAFLDGATSRSATR